MNDAAPAPQTTLSVLFGIGGGPLAWYVQLCAGYALASKPCFRGGELLFARPYASAWATVAAILAAVLVSLAALAVSWRNYRLADRSTPGDVQHAMEAGTGSQRFLALWGVLLSALFAFGASISGAYLLTLPPCFA